MQKHRGTRVSATRIQYIKNTLTFSRDRRHIYYPQFGKVFLLNFISIINRKLLNIIFNIYSQSSLPTNDINQESQRSLLKNTKNQNHGIALS